MLWAPFGGAGARATARGEGESDDRSLAHEHFLWVLGSLCQLFRLPFDGQLLAQQYPAPCTLSTLLAACADLGIEAELRTDQPDLEDHDIPCVALLADGVSNADDGSAAAGVVPALIVRADAERLLYFRAGSDTPRTVARDAAVPIFCPERLICRPKPVRAVADEVEAAPGKFGFRAFVPELLKYKPIWSEVLLASLVIQIIGLAMPLFTQVVIDKVVVHHTTNTLIVVALALVMFTLFSGLMTWVRQYLVLHTGNRVDAVIGNRVFSHLFALPPRYFERRPTGTLVARVQGVETIREFVSGAAVTLLLDLPFLFVFLAVMFFYSWELTLIVLGIVGTITVLSLAITPTLRARLNAQFQLGARNQALLTEYLSGVETVKSLQMEPQLNRRFGDYLGEYLGASFKTRTLSNTYNVLANTLEQVQTLAVLCVGAWLVMTTDSLTIGMLVAFQMFASRMSQPLLRLVGLWQQFQQASIAVKRLGDVMDAPAEPYSVVPARGPAGKGKIELQGLSFRYGEDLPYLYKELDLTIEPGQAVAIMGPSGSGKSTLAKLLQGFYLPSDGRVLIDGCDTRHLSANELRSHFGVVPQETMLFSGTLYDNLIIANPQASFEQVIQACRMAEIHDTIEQLPKGYQTEVGERGVGLSGGQRQRLAIARALLKRPKVLIFDEATSALDAPTAEQLARTVNQLKGKVTLLFVTHRLPQALEVDRTVRLGAAPGDASPAACSKAGGR